MELNEFLREKRKLGLSLGVNRKKILFLDTWPKSIPNIIQVKNELDRLGAQVLMVHWWSTYNSNNIVEEEEIEGITVRDIKYYNTNLIYKIIQIEKPDAVFSVNSVRIYDRAIVLACRKLKIQCSFLMHGTRAFGGKDPMAYAKLLNDVLANSKERVKRISRFLKYVIPNYLYSLYKNDNGKLFSFRWLKILYSYFKNPGISAYYPIYPEELTYDKALVYSNSEIEYHKKLGYKYENIHVVGCPKYDDFKKRVLEKNFSREQLPEKVKKHFKKNQKYVLFLDDSFPESGNIAGIDNSYRNEILNSIASRFEKDNYKLVVKLHPSGNLGDFDDTHSNIIVEKNNLEELIYYSSLCIVHISTTIDQCLICNKPVFHINWGKFSTLPKNFPESGMSTFWNDLDEKINYNPPSLKKHNQLMDNFISVKEPIASLNAAKMIIENKN